MVKILICREKTRRTMLPNTPTRRKNLLTSWLHETVLPLLLSGFALLVLATVATCDPLERISGPFTHDNLVIYLVHGSAKDGPVPMTLQEAVKAKLVTVLETGNVNELAVENLADKEVFIQAGDIVTGGRQDRALTASLVLPPHSGRIPLAALCVESGRWSGRPAEDSRTFKAADSLAPPRAAKTIIGIAGLLSRGNPTSSEPAPTIGAYTAATARSKQQEMWEEARRVQGDLSRNLQAEVVAPESPSSLGLTLDNQKLKAAQKGFTDDLQKLGEHDDDVVGYVVAINGHLNSAAVYESNGLFRKMWPKQLQASVVEALAAGKSDHAASPSSKDVEAFLKAADAGKPLVQELTSYVKQETRDGDQTLLAETQRNNGTWVARSYLAKTQ